MPHKKISYLPFLSFPLLSVLQLSLPNLFLSFFPLQYNKDLGWSLFINSKQKDSTLPGRLLPGHHSRSGEKGVDKTLWTLNCLYEILYIQIIYVSTILLIFFKDDQRMSHCITTLAANGEDGEEEQDRSDSQWYHQ